MRRDWTHFAVYLILLAAIIVGTVFLPVAQAAIQATLTLSPEKINLSNPSDWNSPYMSALVTFPQPYKRNTLDINVSTVLLDGVIPPSITKCEQWTFKAYFDKGAVMAYLWLQVYHMGLIPPFKNVPIVMTVSGQLYDGTPFSGSDTVYVSAR